MTITDGTPPELDDAADVAWDLEPLVEGKGEGGVLEQLDAADRLAEELSGLRGRVADLDSGGLLDAMTKASQIQDHLGRAANYSQLLFSVDTLDPARGALMQMVMERSTAVETKLIFFDLEWAELPDDTATRLLADDRLEFCRHHLEGLRRYRPYLLTEPEEKLDAERRQTGRDAWARLFSEQISLVRVALPDSAQPDGPTREGALEQGLALLQAPDRELRRRAADAVTAGLLPGLRTRVFIFNTLLLDKAIDDRLRGYPTWISSRNLANEASDESVEALVAAVERRYDIPQRWYRLKAQILGVPKLADYDRVASVSDNEGLIGWSAARDLVLDAYRSFSPSLADLARRFFDEGWIDAPVRPAKRLGAFCAYTVPSHHPYVMLNWTARQRDIMTLAHELGHGLHAYLAREQGVFHQSTPLTLAETASVFGETVTFGRVLEAAGTPDARLSLLAQSIDGAVATVFRQTAMNRFEAAVHTARREEGELSIDRFGELWAATQGDMLGDSVEITDGYRSWWSYIPHFIGSPGYVYAYAYGQLLALSVYRRYEEQGSDFVPRYLHMLSAGGSMGPEDLARIVGCDLADPGFWDGGLAIVEEQLEQAEAAAHAAGRLAKPV